MMQLPIIIRKRGCEGQKEKYPYNLPWARHQSSVSENLQSVNQRKGCPIRMSTCDIFQTKMPPCPAVCQEKKKRKEKGGILNIHLYKSCYLTLAHLCGGHPKFHFFFPLNSFLETLKCVEIKLMLFSQFLKKNGHMYQIHCLLCIRTPTALQPLFTINTQISLYQGVLKISVVQNQH